MTTKIHWVHICDRCFARYETLPSDYRAGTPMPLRPIGWTGNGTTLLCARCTEVARVAAKVSP